MSFFFTLLYIAYLIFIILSFLAWLRKRRNFKIEEDHLGLRERTDVFIRPIVLSAWSLFLIIFYKAELSPLHFLYIFPISSFAISILFGPIVIHKRKEKRKGVVHEGEVVNVRNVDNV